MSSLAAIPVSLALVLVCGCASTRWNRDTEMTANQPRALGLGSFAPSCFFICFVESHFEQIEQGGTDKDGAMRYESRSGIYTGPKRDDPKEPKP
jgi:hypothetical protein